MVESALYCSVTTRPDLISLLKTVLRDNPNLKRLGLALGDIEGPYAHPPEISSLCLDFRVDDKVASLTHFAMEIYPALIGRHWSPYQINALVRELDWSSLQVLSIANPTLANALIPHCPRLSNLFTRRFKPRELVRALRLCTPLKRLAWTPYPTSQWETEISDALVRHGQSLTYLSINRNEPGLDSWPRAFDEEAAQRLRAAVPKVAFLAIGLYRDNSWVSEAPILVRL